MPSEYSGSSIPPAGVHRDAVLIRALKAAADPDVPGSVPAVITSNRMLHVLQEAAPQLYAHWAEGLLSNDAALDRAGAAADVMLIPCRGRGHDGRCYGEMGEHQRCRAEFVLRAALGLKERT